MVACGADDDGAPADSGAHTYTKMEAETADCEFDLLTFKTHDGVLHEVHINGLTVESLLGANKVSGTEWEVVERRGVRFSAVLAKAGLSSDASAPVNCIARDGWDPLRTQLANDVSKLPLFDFVSTHGYVYVGNPGDKDPVYPEMEGRSLIVDYDLGTDAEVPAYLGASLAGLGKFRWKMVEQLDTEHRGIFEIDPIL